MVRVPSRDEVQTLLRALLVTRKEAFTIGIPIAVLDNDYKEQEGTRIPFRAHNHTCLLDFLQNLSGGLSVKYRDGMYYAYPVVTEKSKHVSSLVAGQNTKKSSVRGRRRTIRPSAYFPRVYQPPVRLDRKMLADIVTLVKNNPNGLLISRILLYARDRFNLDLDLTDLTRQLRDISHEIMIDHDSIYPVTTHQQQQQQQQQPRSRESWTNGENQNVVAPATAPMGADDKYSNGKAGGLSDSDREDEGYTDDFVPNVAVARNDVPQRDQDCEIYENVENETIASLINERTRIRLKKLIEKHPDGILCAELPGLYLQEYTIPLNYEDLGFDSVRDYASYLPEIFQYVRLQNGEYKLFGSEVAKPNVKDGERTKLPTLASLHNIYDQFVTPMEPIPTVLSKANLERLIPDGVMTLGETVRPICVTELQCGTHEYIDVIVSDVFTPSFFWVQLPQRIPKLNEMMDELHEFYEIHSKKYLLPIAVMEKGMNCACMYGDTWHRGIIKSIRSDNTVTVEFYDYGTIMSYPAKCIHFLHKTFSTLPAQAIACGLYNVKPVVGTQWHRSISVEFVGKVMNVTLVATIGSMDTDNNSMLVALTNTEGKEDFHINDWMVASGMAVYGKMVRIRPPNYPFQRFLECKFPSCSVRGDLESTSSDSKKLNLERNKSVSNVPASTRNDGFYDSLLKLRRGSRAGKNTSYLSIGEIPRREKRLFFNNIQSQTGKCREAENVASRKVDDGSNGGTRGKTDETGLTREFYETRGTTSEETTSYVGITDSSLDERRDETYVIDETSSNTQTENNVIFHNGGETRNVDNDDTGTISNGVDIFDKDICEKVVISKFPIEQAVPLHLREVSGPREKLSDFGTFHSRLGGNARVEFIDWSLARSPPKIDEKTIQVSTNSSVTSKTNVQNERESNDTFDKRRINESTKFGNNRDKCITNEHKKITGESKKSLDGELTKKVSSPSCPNFPKSKRTLWNNVKSRIEKKNLENPKMPQIDTNFVDNMEKRTKTSEKMLSNVEDKKNPKFVNHHVNCVENIDEKSVMWSEVRRVMKNPEEVSPVSIKEQSRKKQSVKIPTKLPRVNKAFAKIVKKTEHSDSTNLDTSWINGGNIEMINDVTPWMRMIVKKLKIERKERAKIFVSDNILEIMRNRINDEISSSELENTYNESEISNFSTDDSERDYEKIAKKHILYDRMKKKFVKVDKIQISRTTEETSSEMLPEMSDISNSNGETTKLNDLVDDSTSIRSSDVESRKNEKFRENSSSSNCEILPFSPPVETLDGTIGKSSSPLEKLLSTSNNEATSSRELNLQTNVQNFHQEATNSWTNEKRTSPTKNTASWLRNVCLKRNAKQLSKLINSRLDSTNDSGLDSDDLSTAEEINRYKNNEKSINVINPTSSIDQFAATENSETDVSTESMEKIIKNVDNLTKNIDLSAGNDEEPQTNCENDDEIVDSWENEKSLELTKFVNLEVTKNSISNIDVSIVNMTKNNVKNVPIFDDHNVKSDDEEWDYSPGWYDRDIVEARENGTIVQDELPTMTSNSMTNERKKLEKILSGDESSSLEISDNVEIDTSRNGSSRQETDTDEQMTENKYYFMENLETSCDNTTFDETKNFTFTKQDSTFEDVETREFSRSRDFSNDKEPLIDFTVISDYKDETTVLDDTIDENVVSTKGHYSIMSEIKKSKILNISNIFSKLDGDCSSGEKSDGSYKSSVMNVFKRYF